ncbi:MAG: TIM barrel protein [Gemmataceae bacterium]
MNRREFLATATAIGAKCAIADAQVRSRLGLVIHSYWVRAKSPALPDFGPINEPQAFAAHAARLGAAGVQIRVPPRPVDELHRLRDFVAEKGLYLEGIVALPKNDADCDRFDAEVKANRTAGVEIVRTVCMSGRRYEEFTSGDQFRTFAERAWASLRLAEPIAARHKVKVAVENHKDWRVDEMSAWLKQLSSEWVGVCVDTGNSMALLEEPHGVVEAYAPYALTTHLKDMAVADCADGFLLAEVPLGDGCIDISRVVATLRKANPSIRLNLEMITRDPLRIPCLTPKYWATLADVRGRDLAEALARVKRLQPTKPLVEYAKLDHVGQLRAEHQNIEQCLQYARQRI